MRIEPFKLPLRLLWKALSKPEMIPVRLFAPPLSTARQAIRQFLPEVDDARLITLTEELMGNHEFHETLNRTMFLVRRRRVAVKVWNEFVYLLVRLVQPNLMIETGVFDGLSSAVTLEAMRINGKGTLISIDLPATEVIPGSTDAMLNTTLPPGRDPGWLIADHLRARHRLELGDARQLLPQVLAAHGPIDIFLHDSLHTYDHMMFEFRAAWEALRPGGFFLSDDATWNAAYHQFCRAKGIPYALVDGALGVTRKSITAA